MLSKYAILLDGGFVTKKLQGQLKRFPTAADVNQECQRIAQHQQLANRDLLRIYFYDASPAKDRLTNPIDGSARDTAPRRLVLEAWDRLTSARGFPG